MKFLISAFIALTPVVSKADSCSIKLRPRLEAGISDLLLAGSYNKAKMRLSQLISTYDRQAKKLTDGQLRTDLNSWIRAENERKGYLPGLRPEIPILGVINFTMDHFLQVYRNIRNAHLGYVDLIFNYPNKIDIPVYLPRIFKLIHIEILLHELHDRGLVRD